MSRPISQQLSPFDGRASAFARWYSVSFGLGPKRTPLLLAVVCRGALAQLRKEGFQVCDEDVARLSPLGHEHINMLGRYNFTLPDQVARGKLRPLRDPKEG